MQGSCDILYNLLIHKMGVLIKHEETKFIEHVIKKFEGLYVT